MASRELHAILGDLVRPNKQIYAEGLRCRQPTLRFVPTSRAEKMRSSEPRVDRVSAAAQGLCMLSQRR